MKTPDLVDVASLATQKRLTRRQLLSNSARAAVTAAASMLMPPNGRRMLAKDLPSRRSLRDIKHVVVLMQENRSFDHYFGTLAGVRGFDDPKSTNAAEGPLRVLSAGLRKSERISAALTFGHACH